MALPPGCIAQKPADIRDDEIYHLTKETPLYDILSRDDADFRLEQIASQNVPLLICRSLLPIACVSRFFNACAYYTQQKAMRKYEKRNTRAALTLYLESHLRTVRTQDSVTTVTDRARRYQHTYVPWPWSTWQIKDAKCSFTKRWWETHDGIKYFPRTSILYVGVDDEDEDGELNSQFLRTRFAAQ